MSVATVDTWYALGGPQELPIDHSRWMEYDPESMYHLTQNYQVVTQTQGETFAGKILDLRAFTDPPLPYEIHKGREVLVANPHAPASIRGKRTVAGYDVSLWEHAKINNECLPPQARMGSVVGYFYQVHVESAELLTLLERYLADASGQTPPIPIDGPGAPRRRIVILVRPSKLASDPNRFRKRRARGAAVDTTGSAAADISAATNEEAAVTIVEESKNVGSVMYEWWYGPAPPQALVGSVPVGRWKMYHPQVCRKLESCFQTNRRFSDAEESVDIDGVRYMLQRITPDKPFNYVGQPSREPFLSENIVTVEHPVFSAIERTLGNCFVQFQKGNPQRRRPVRRQPDASDIARGAMMTGDACAVCFSEEGQLTGCNRAHVICKSCLRRSLRAMTGDTLVVEHLICGCFGKATRRALMVLAERADVSLAEALANPPTSGYDKQDWDSELADTRRQFDLDDGPIPDDVYLQKVKHWYKTVTIGEISHLYYPCSDPACADKVENWKLITDFEEERDNATRSGRPTSSIWTCPAGHRNSVLPSEDEIKDINKNLLSHPEYYVESAPYSSIPLRRYRICCQCAEGGVLMLAVHGGECKQWPGYGNGHHHCFCFACTRTWGSGCNHSSQTCADPGVQQVRCLGDALQVGHVDSNAYIRWLRGEERDPPPTVFADGSTESGNDRQQRLEMTDRAALCAEMNRGTT
eukprot:TRINITY_DN21605_c0_g4_i1.p1 TRINITY_DN21605_c0_g4~~TRINITY_DN21605_c0_g4_i1.p1  ORF type:complete len:697 (-),score=69.87 TRINITY_DN21605_c0_g4_i1:93-2183(-)